MMTDAAKEALIASQAAEIAELKAKKTAHEKVSKNEEEEEEEEEEYEDDEEDAHLARFIVWFDKAMMALKMQPKPDFMSAAKKYPHMNSDADRAFVNFMMVKDLTFYLDHVKSWKKDYIHSLAGLLSHNYDEITETKAACQAASVGGSNSQ